MKKRFSAFLLAALMVAALLPTAGFAAETQVADSPALADAISNAGDGDVIVLAAGTYTMPGTMDNKNLTIKGASADTVTISMLNGPGNANQQYARNSTLTFENVSFELHDPVNSNDWQVAIFAHATQMTFNGCKFNDPYVTQSSTVFNNCEFAITNAAAYNLYLYGGTKHEVNNCTFACAGKSVLVYNEGHGGLQGSEISFTDCTFDASVKASGKAAIEIDSSMISGSYDIGATDCTATGFDKGSNSGNELWNVKSSKPQDQTAVEVIVTPAPAYAGPVMNWVKVNAASNGVVKSGPLAASAGATVTLYPKAAEGYVLDTVEVLDAEGNTVELDGLKFAIPAGGVTVNATFKLAD